MVGSDLLELSLMGQYTIQGTTSTKTAPYSMNSRDLHLEVEVVGVLVVRAVEPGILTVKSVTWRIFPDAGGSMDAVAVEGLYEGSILEDAEDAEDADGS
jgi:hypothetical protein